MSSVFPIRLVSECVTTFTVLSSSIPPCDYPVSAYESTSIKVYNDTMTGFAYTYVTLFIH